MQRTVLVTCSEISILMPDEISGNEERSIICSMRARDHDRFPLRVFPDYHRSYDPLQYPLMFPDGTDGWYLEMKSNNLRYTNNITNAEYIRYHVMSRSEPINHLHLMGKLYQQFIVDQFAKIEMQKLRFIRGNQTHIRADLYISVLDSINRRSVQNSEQTAIILPASFTMGDRFMSEYYKDAMALVREYGKPTFFVTVTCNTKWPEITEQLKPGQSVFDRSDIVC